MPQGVLINAALKAAAILGVPARVGIGVVPIGVALALTPLLAQPADARVALGVQDDELSSGPLDEIPRRLDLVEQSRARVTRVDALWRNIAPTRPADPSNPDDPAYRWERLDTIVRGLERRGIAMIITAYTAPAWATTTPDAARGEVNPIAPEVPEFADFMAALASRYSGRHAPPGAETLPEVRHLEIWNEPNLQSFLAPQVIDGTRFALRRYVRMLSASYPRIKEVHPGSVVLAGVAGPRSSTSDTGTGSRDWMRGVLRSGAPFDGYSQHVYPARGPKFRTRAFPAWRTIGQAIRMLDALPEHRGKPYYITEAGYTTLPTPRRSVQVSEPAQAEFLEQILENSVVRSDRVPVVMWFNLQDQEEWPGGLRRGDGSERPSWEVFRRLAARHDRMPPGPGGAVRMTAGQLLTNQRVSQAAVRRANAVAAMLDELSGADIRPGGLRPETFGASVAIAGDDSQAATRPLSRSITTEPRQPTQRASARDGLELSVGQLRINQAVSQAAVRRANALAARIERGLTGADVEDGTIEPDRLAEGLRVLSADAGSPAPEPGEPVVPTPAPTSGDGRLDLTTEQLLTNQRIAQAAVRRTNSLIRLLEVGLTSEHFRPGSLHGDDLAD